MRQTLPMIRLVLAAILMATPLAATAQPPAPSPAPAARPWQVDYGQYYCSMIRKAEADRPYATAFVSIPGLSKMHIALVPQAGGTFPAGVTDVALLPGGTRFHIIREDTRGGSVPIQRLYDLPVEFADQLTGAEALELRSGARAVGRVPLAGVRDALAVYRRCLTEVSTEWGIDEAALTALRHRPNSTNRLGFHAEDYPPQLLNSAVQGRVIMRIDVSTEGRATACVPVATSGSPIIDRRACEVALLRARFTPGIDSNGAPVATRAVFMVTFRPWARDD